jgi:peptidoglycan hydrolase-like protein with peptidoglycan-binding domain
MIRTSDLLTSLLTVGLITLLFSINIVKAEYSVFSRPLKVGVTGEDVRELQKILNSRPETAIRGTGVGSTGQETTYFGNLTREAVVRFQEIYRDTVLVPNGLSSGTGYVGPATLALLRELSVAKQIPAQQAPVTVLPTTSLSSITLQPISPTVSTTDNPNSKNLDVFFSAIDRIGIQKGFSADTLAQVKKQVRIDISTSTNLQNTFIEMVRGTLSKSPVPVQTVSTQVKNAIRTAFAPKRANAASGTPFGGALLFSFFCTCSANWLVTVQPLAPSYVTLLSYTPGTQAFLSYNIPFTTQLLGQYTPGAGMCLIYVGTGL